jgi:hypothetical protein
MTSPPDERDRKLGADAIMGELRQLNSLLDLEPPLSVDEIAHRMAWKPKDLRKLLKMMRITRG